MESTTPLEDLQAARRNTTRAPFQPLMFSAEVERRIAEDWPDVWEAIQVLTRRYYIGCGITTRNETKLTNDFEP